MTWPLLLIISLGIIFGLPLVAVIWTEWIMSGILEREFSVRKVIVYYFYVFLAIPIWFWSFVYKFFPRKLKEIFNDSVKMLRQSLEYEFDIKD